MIELLTLGGVALLLAAAARARSTTTSSPSPAPPAPSVTGDCSRQFFPALRSSGQRPVAIRLVVVHSTEGGSAAGAASWFQDLRVQGSAHLVVDDGACFRTLEDNVRAWGAPGANDDGLHIEIAGYAKWSRAEWLTHIARIERAALHIAAWCQKYGLPATFLDASSLRSAQRGITTHANVTAAYSGGAGHWDPGPGFPMDVLIDRVRAHLGGGASPNVA